MWFAFVLIWIALAYVFLSTQPTIQEHRKVSLFAPTIKRACLSQRVACIDECNFLCIEDESKCIGGICQTRLDPIDCNTAHGGLLVVANDPTPHWTCICTDATIWGGPDCSRLNPDVCENGLFLYNSPNKAVCVCPEPFVKLVINDKEHCLSKTIAKFLQDEDSSHVVQGASNKSR